MKGEVRAGHGKGTAVRRLSGGGCRVLNQEEERVTRSTEPHGEGGIDHA